MGNTSHESEVKEEEKPVNAPVSRETRRAYVFFVTTFCLLSCIGMVIFGATGPLALAVVNGFVYIIIVALSLYIGGSIMDRSEFLGKLADAFNWGKKK